MSDCNCVELGVCMCVYVGFGCRCSYLFGVCVAVTLHHKLTTPENTQLWTLERLIALINHTECICVCVTVCVNMCLNAQTHILCVNLCMRVSLFTSH